MKKLHLHYEKELKGRFEIKDLNLLLVFQVNCPGCFFYALPLFQELYRQLDKQEIGFLALSTAFEDFELNTQENTRALIDNGLLVGETKKAMSERDIYKLPFDIDFPVAVDQVSKDKGQITTDICELNPNFRTWPDFDKEAMKQKVHNYLNRLEKISYTFTSNQFKGTPTFVLFNKQKEILQSWFGHIDKNTIESAVGHYQEIIKKYP